MSDLVSCRSDSEYAERPIAIEWEGEHHDIAEIIARWREPGGKYFRVITEQNLVFILQYDLVKDEWHIQQP